jgi:hypothetical protein
MQAKKTHEQQLRIIEKRDETSNAGPDFDVKGDLARSEAAKKTLAAGTSLRTGMKDITSDRGIIRGQNQESEHHKRTGH